MRCRESSGYLQKPPWVDHRSLAPLCRKTATYVPRYATHARTHLIRTWFAARQDLHREKVHRVSRNGCFVSFHATTDVCACHYSIDGASWQSFYDAHEYIIERNWTSQRYYSNLLRDAVKELPNRTSILNVLRIIIGGCRQVGKLNNTKWQTNDGSCT